MGPRPDWSIDTALFENAFQADIFLRENWNRKEASWGLGRRKVMRQFIQASKYGVMEASGGDPNSC